MGFVPLRRRAREAQLTAEQAINDKQRDLEQRRAQNAATVAEAEAERAHISRVLEAVQWNKKEAARVLDISRGTLYRKIAEYALEQGGGSLDSSGWPR